MASALREGENQKGNKMATKTKDFEMHLVRCGDYNGFKNVLFLMKSNDFRFNDGNYMSIERGMFVNRRKNFVTDSGDLYKVASDWSVKKVSDFHKGE